MKRAREKSLFGMLVSPLAWPLVLLYAMGVRLKNAAYDLHLLKPRRLTWPVISVGNLSVGGTGKTPVVLLLAELLSARGWSVDVLSRGYGRSNQRVMRVDPQGAWEEFGDEPFLMAQNGVSVYVGAGRYQPGLLAEKAAAASEAAGREIPRRTHILDDGFQHRKLARAVDIVLLQREDLKDDMLPLGRLREPLCALERADICVLREEDAALSPRVLQLMGQTDPAHIWIVKRRTVVSAMAAFPDPTPSALAFCAIGDSQGFFHSLREAGVDVQSEMAFRDHHVYTDKDVERLITAAQSSESKCFVTTEKDSVRFSRDLRSKLENKLPLLIAGLELSLQEEARAMEMLEALIAKRLQGSRHDVR